MSWWCVVRLLLLGATTRRTEEQRCRDVPGGGRLPWLTPRPISLVPPCGFLRLWARAGIAMEKCSCYSLTVVSWEREKKILWKSKHWPANCLKTNSMLKLAVCASSVPWCEIMQYIDHNKNCGLSGKMQMFGAYYKSYWISNRILWLFITFNYREQHFFFQVLTLGSLLAERLACNLAKKAKQTVQQEKKY